MPTAPPSRYDSPWKTAATHAFRAFMAFFFNELYSQIDWSYRPRFLDKELAQFDLGDAPAGMLADLLVELQLKDGTRKLVLVHIEVQAQRDASLARRVLDYNYRISTRYRKPVASLVLLADDDPSWRPQAFHTKVLGTEMGISFATAKLLDYADQANELLSSRNPFALVTLAHLRTQQALHDPGDLYAAKWQLTKLLFRHGWSKTRIIILFKVINWMMALPEPVQARYWRNVIKFEKERKMEWISPLEESFLDRGRKEGAAGLLEKQLTVRFGPLPRTVRSKLAKASVEQLGSWGSALLQAQSLKQVFDERIHTS